jgi:pyruvate dehydrogenase phosphatase
MNRLFQEIGPPIPLKRPALSMDPSTQVCKLKPNDLFLIFASDGLWEHLGDDTAVQFFLKKSKNCKFSS